MTEQHILLDETDHVATITLNRPERMNAFAKRGLQRLAGWDLGQALDYGVSVLQMLRKSRDVGEGIATFLEKRDPRLEDR